MSKTLAIPLPTLSSNGDKVYQWMGALWSNLFKDGPFIRQTQQANGLLTAQLYLDFLETAKLTNHNESPVFHRNRWQPVVLRKSQLNSGDAVTLKLQDSPVPKIGPQTDVPFVIGQLPKIGGNLPLAGISAYPLVNVVDFCNVLVDDIAKPKVVWMKGIDFVVQADTLLLYNSRDPFDGTFPIEQLPDGDQQVTLWAMDALLDKDYVYDYLGYVMGVHTPSTEFYSNYLRALWNIYNQGATLALFAGGLAALLDEPAILDASETITQIVTGAKPQVITDKHVYDINDTAVLNPAVVVGAVLPMGTILTQTIRIYDNLDPARLSAGTPYGDRLRSDIMSLCLPPAFFRARINHSLGLTWQLENITYAGRDANGNAKLRFTLYGDADDIEVFWQDFWNYCERNQIDGEACLHGFLYDTLPDSEAAVWGKLSPLEYFLSNFLKANLLVIVVDSSKLSTAGRNTLSQVTLLRAVIPAAVCFFVIESLIVNSEQYAMGENVMDKQHTPLFTNMRNEIAGSDEYDKVRMTYRAAKPISRWIPVCSGV